MMVVSSFCVCAYAQVNDKEIKKSDPQNEPNVVNKADPEVNTKVEVRPEDLDKPEPGPKDKVRPEDLDKPKPEKDKKPAPKPRKRV